MPSSRSRRKIVKISWAISFPKVSFLLGSLASKEAMIEQRSSLVDGLGQILEEVLEPSPPRRVERDLVISVRHDLVDQDQDRQVLIPGDRQQIDKQRLGGAPSRSSSLESAWRRRRPSLPAI